MSPLVLTIDETAELLGVSREKVRQMVIAGDLPEVDRLGRRRLIPRRAVEQLVEQALEGWDPAEASRHLKAVS